MVLRRLQKRPGGRCRWSLRRVYVSSSTSTVSSMCSAPGRTSSGGWGVAEVALSAGHGGQGKARGRQSALGVVELASVAWESLRGSSREKGSRSTGLKKLQIRNAREVAVMRGQGALQHNGSGGNPCVGALNLSPRDPALAAQAGASVCQVRTGPDDLVLLKVSREFIFSPSVPVPRVRTVPDLFQRLEGNDCDVTANPLEIISTSVVPTEDAGDNVGVKDYHVPGSSDARRDPREWCGRGHRR